MEYRPDKIIVHHSAATLPVPQFDEINQWHKARDFPLSTLGFYVGYHIVIEPDGVRRRARLDMERDADALGHNFDSLSVCLVGNFDKSDPTAAQVAALGAQLSEWCALWKLGPGEIHPHRKVGATKCPGSRLSNNWAALVFLKFELERILKMIRALRATV